MCVCMHVCMYVCMRVTQFLGNNGIIRLHAMIFCRVDTHTITYQSSSGVVHDTTLLLNWEGINIFIS